MVDLHESTMQTYTITELAKEFDVTTRTIRFYEEKRLLFPTRNGQSRVYSHQDRTMLKLTLRGKRLGFSLDETQQLIQMYDPKHGNVNQMKRMIQKIEEQQVKLEERVHDIEVVKHELKQAKIRCEEALKAATQDGQQLMQGD